jgi:transposase
MSRPLQYPVEPVRRGARLALQSGRPVRHVGADLGIGHETLRRAVRQVQADGGQRPDLPSSEEREEIRQLRKENFRVALRERDPQSNQRVFRGRARPRPDEVSVFIDEHRGRFGVEPICRVLGVSASADYHRRHGVMSARAQEGARLLVGIARCTAPTGCSGPTDHTPDTQPSESRKFVTPPLTTRSRYQLSAQSRRVERRGGAATVLAAPDRSPRLAGHRGGNAEFKRDVCGRSRADHQG